MIFKGIQIADSSIPVDITINEGKISSVIPSPIHGEHQLTGFIAFPGLINSHDHLDFNLFPQLGERTYKNYKEWGLHLHASYKADIEKVLKIPRHLRAIWGIFKNLLGGVTTVVHHGPTLKNLPALMTLHQKTHNLHSVQFERLWKIKLNHPLKKSKPCVIHSGEGIDSVSEQEIDQLLKWNLINRKLIGVHGIAMNVHQAAKFKALIWCPESNYFMFQQTAPIHELKQHVKILFGTDSTLTANWNIWNHIHHAREKTFLNDIELYHSLTVHPANAWGLPCGSLSQGKDADIVIAHSENRSIFFDSFYNCSPEKLQLVMKKGKLLLIDQSFLPCLSLTPDQLDQFSMIELNGSFKYVPSELIAVVNKIKQYASEIKLPFINN